MGPHLFVLCVKKTSKKIAPYKRAHPTAKPLSVQVSGFETSPETPD
jgi:hypothetical protein